MFSCLLQAGERNFFTTYSQNPERTIKSTPVHSCLSLILTLKHRGKRVHNWSMNVTKKITVKFNNYLKLTNYYSLLNDRGKRVHVGSTCTETDFIITSRFGEVCFCFIQTPSNLPSELILSYVVDAP